MGPLLELYLLLSLVVIFVKICGVVSKYILYISTAVITLDLSYSDFHLTCSKPDVERISLGKLNISLAALRCRDSNLLKSSLLVHPPNKRIAYVTEGN